MMVLLLVLSHLAAFVAGYLVRRRHDKDPIKLQ